MCSGCCGKKKKKKKADEDDIDYGFIRKKQQWNTYTFSCCENWGNCCYCIFCCPCFMADLFHYANSMPWAMAILFGILLLPLNFFLWIPMRARIRYKHKLEGSCGSDLCCLLFCCWPFVLCQIRDEIQYLRSRKKWQLGYQDEVGGMWQWCISFCKKRPKRESDEEDKDEESEESEGDEKDDEDDEDTSDEEEDDDEEDASESGDN
ncbi:hypothetical protein CSKR_202278 [Clonorchis sinensis]|uniref:Uncharacterized protein n=1 Tax=Clonorchis sinensis TaxID=79923 RepID=A0A8T1MV16_CLOSI|nr:hypothetical protein CSKR_202278 [Clonorchis sinensis]